MVYRVFLSGTIIVVVVVSTNNCTVDQTLNSLPFGKVAVII